MSPTTATVSWPKQSSGCQLEPSWAGSAAGQSSTRCHHKWEGEPGENARVSLSMIPVLGSWILTERLLCVHSSHIFANKQAQVTPVLAAGQSASRAQDQSHWFILHSNQQGRSKYMLYLPTFPPCSSPAPSLASYIPLVRPGDLLCHH